MEDKFKATSSNEVLVTTPSGRTLCVAECNDAYWADAVAYALNFLRTEEM